MLISDFLVIVKDFAMLILGAISSIIGTLFNMPLFGAISIGQILLAFAVFNIVFIFILSCIKDKFGSQL